MRREFRSMSLSAALTLGLCSAAGHATAADVREIGSLVFDGIPPMPDDLRASLRERARPYQLARAAYFQDWSDDGSILITTRFGQTFQVHQVMSPGGDRRQITFSDDGVGAAIAVPRQDAIIFQSDHDGDELYQLYLQDLAGGAARQLTDAGFKNDDFVVSRDGELLAWSRLTPGKPDYDVMVMDPRDPASRRVALKGRGAMAPLDVSQDRTKVLLGQEVSDTVTRRYVLDLASGALRPVGDPKAAIEYDGGRFTPDGKAVLVISDEGGEFKRLVRIDIATGRRTVLTAAINWNVEAFDLSRNGDLLAYSINQDGISHIILQDYRTGGSLPPPSLPDGVLVSMGFSPDGKKLAINLSTPKSPKDVWSWDVASGRIERWTHSELGGLDPASLVQARLIHFRTFDDRMIPAFVYPSPAAGPRPVIIYIHGGPDVQDRPEFYPTYQYWIRQLGATVITPNVRGSSGYGRTYTGLDNGYGRENAFKDIGALLSWIHAQPDLDSRRVVVYGGSAAGLLVLGSMVRYPDDLAGGVDICGVSDITSFLETTEGYRRDLRRPEYGDERDPQMRAFQRRISPLYNADRITKPVLVIQGAKDPRAPKSQADQIVAKLRANGRSAWYLWAKDEGHGFRKADNQEAQREVETLFLQQVFEGR